jgi:MoaA/NifB/PqqE/SkfB family radical SAM enzyme
MKAQEIVVSLNPTYLCNFRCNFCYLTPEQLADKSKLDLNRLEEMLIELKSYKTVAHVDLYGGEIALLPENYLSGLDALVYEHTGADINVITNLSKVHPFFLEDCVDLSVSYDFEAREQHEKVYQNIMGIDKVVSILILASPDVIKRPVESMISTLNTLQNVKSVEIKPYSSNQANSLTVTHRDFEDFVRKWIESPVKKNFDFENEKRVNRSLSGSYNAFSDDHVYITPQGRWAALEFDSNDNEFFLEFDKFEGYLEWANKEKLKVSSGSFCGSCEYFGSCLTEHYRPVYDMTNSCNGYKGLLDWAKNKSVLTMPSGI